MLTLWTFFFFLLCVLLYTHRQPGLSGVLWEVHNSSQTLLVRVRGGGLLAFSVTRHHVRMESVWQPGVLGPAAATDGAFRGWSVPRCVDHNLVTLKGTLRGWHGYFCIKSTSKFARHYLDSKRVDVNDSDCNPSVKGRQCGACLIVPALLLMFSFLTKPAFLFSHQHQSCPRTHTKKYDAINVAWNCKSAPWFWWLIEYWTLYSSFCRAAVNHCRISIRLLVIHFAALFEGSGRGHRVPRGGNVAQGLWTFVSIWGCQGECQECVCFLVENLNQTQTAVLCLFTIMATFLRLSAGVDHYYVFFLQRYLWFTAN